MTVNVTAYLCCNGAAKALEFYRACFGAQELSRMDGPDGKLGHAEMRIGETVLFVSDEWPEGNVHDPKHWGGSAVSFVLEVPDADAAFAQATASGCSIDRPVRDEPFGRAGWVIDPWGYHWCLFHPPARDAS